MFYAVRNFAHSGKSCKVGQEWSGGNDSLLEGKGLVQKFKNAKEAKAFFAKAEKSQAAHVKKGANSNTQSRILGAERKAMRTAKAEEASKAGKPKEESSNESE